MNIYKQKEYPITEECTINTQAPLVERVYLDNSRAHPKYWSCLYQNGQLIDDLLNKDTEHVYWEAFIDPKQAQELKDRLAHVEHPDWVPGSMDFLPMSGKDDDNEQTNEE